MATAHHYIDTYHDAHRLAMKVCFIVNETDLALAFKTAGVPLTPVTGQKTKASFWNNRELLCPGEVAVEIYQDAGCEPGYLVYEKLFRTGADYKVKQQILKYEGALTGQEATLLYEALLPCDRP